MPTLGVVMIVRDEADCLGDCLASVQDIADEIVIGDTGSADETPDIARRAGARVFEVPWDDDFAAARNVVIAAARADWLLHLDADEALDARGAARIRRVVDHDGFGADAVELILANYCDEPRAWRWRPASPDDPMARGHAGYIAAPLLRLFRNDPAFEYREPVHENITESVVAAGGRIRREDVLVHHYGYCGAQHRPKAGRYLALARRKAQARPADPKSLHDWAEQACACGLAEEAETACRRALAVDDTHLAAGMTLANLLLNRGAFEEAEAILVRLEAQGHGTPHIGTALAAIALREGNLAEAGRRLNAAIAAAPDAALARLYRARLYDVAGQPEAAREDLEHLAAALPAAEEPRRRLESHALREAGEAAYAAGAPERALASFARALKIDPEDPITHNNLGVVFFTLGQSKAARASFERALKLAPAMEGPRENLAACNTPAPAG